MGTHSDSSLLDQTHRTVAVDWLCVAVLIGSVFTAGYDLFVVVSIKESLRTFFVAVY